MRAYPDTSFLCSLYRNQVFTPRAISWMEACEEPLSLSSLELLELRQSTRFQVNLHQRDRSKGFSEREARAMLRDLQSDLAGGVLEVVPVDWADVHQIAERLSAARTMEHGCRLIDLLHVATGIHLGAEEFLSFDANQRAIAAAEGMRVVV